jgi:TRAP-type C4-dicarboxylate transport system substrate-binding protein
VREIASTEFETKINAKLLAMLPYGNSLVGNAIRPIHTVEDYKGLKLRNAGAAQATMYRALGVVPTEMSSREVYMALQRGTIDGATSGPSRFYLSKWYEVTTYITQDYSLPYLSFWLSIGLKFWNKLSMEDQKLLADAAQEVEMWSRKYVVDETKGFYEKMKSSDKVKDFYFLPKNEVAKIEKIAAPIMKNLIIKRAGKDMGEELWDLVQQTKK